MSQARITLRPPPNVEFVQGYPGIPGNGHDRPHAEVRGTIELRLGNQGVKAKWVQVELRKVETLPGGGQANTFYDYVGTSPVKVWGPSEEWGFLQTQDFPFSIRIPESIPPSIALEKNAGIKYELVAKVCMKGKKGIFRRSASPTLSNMTQIVIDKHELHSTWPVYSQPDSRSVVESRLTLSVDRTHTCYGPGDKITVVATFRNDSTSTVDLRSFEFTLKEVVIFRAGPHGHGKKGAPVVRPTMIGEQRVPMNQTVYGGQQHRADLSCIVPPTHTTTTVNAARHIDIAYTLCIKAILGSGRPLLMDLPVTISNWPRNMSSEAIRRIGPSAGLSLLHPNAAAMSIQHGNAPMGRRPGSSDSNSYQAHPRPGMQQSNVRPFSIAERVGSHSQQDTISSTQGYNTAGIPGIRRPGFDEFGQPILVNGRQVPASYAGPNRISNYNVGIPGGPPNGMPETRRQQTLNVAPANRLTLVNADSREDDSPSETGSPRRYLTAAEEKKQLQNPGGSGQGQGGGMSRSEGSANMVPAAERQQANGNTNPSLQSSPPRRNNWPTAEEEKSKLYNKARSNAEQVQASLGNLQIAQKMHQRESSANDVLSPQPRRAELARELSTSPPVAPPAAVAAPARSLSPVPAPIPPPAGKKPVAWASAEEEKTRLYNNAQRVAQRTQAMAVGMPPPEPSQQYGSGSGSSSQFAPPEPKAAISAGAALYQSAMASVIRPDRNAGRPSSPPDNGGSAYGNPPSPPAAPRNRYPTAEEEKAALRYYEAKRAVDRHQNLGNYRPSSATSSNSATDDLIAYDALYPAQPSGSGSRSYMNQNGPSAPGSSHMSIVPSPEETSYSSPEIPSYQPPPPTQSNTTLFNSAMAEKEKLRKRFEMEDAAASSSAVPPRVYSPDPVLQQTTGSPPPSPPGYGGPPATSSGRRAPPAPPVNPGAPVPLSAAEEKARLRAQYEAEDAAANAGSSGSVPGYASPPPGSYGSGLTSAPSNMHIPQYSYDNRSHSAGGSSSFAPPPPPPLAPRPPREYIQETEEEDALSQAEDHVMTTVGAQELPGPRNGHPSNSRLDFGLPFRPFSPLDMGSHFASFDKNNNRGNPAQSPLAAAPALPPKVPVFD